MSTQNKPIDSHCHLYDEKFIEDRNEIIYSSLEKLDGLVIIIEEPFNISPSSLIKHSKIRYSVGFHPYYSEQVSPENLEKLNLFMENGNVGAIGEIGLDYYHCKVPKDVQKKAFIQQIDFAQKYNLPIVIHSRNAEKDTYAILHDYYKILPAVVLHCYGGDVKMVEPFLELNCFISFAGNITYPKAVDLRTCVEKVPLKSLLLETDAPYLAPQPVRGRRCLPEYVLYTAEKIAEIKKVDIDELIYSTRQNTKKVFSLE